MMLWHAVRLPTFYDRLLDGAAGWAPCTRRRPAPAARAQRAGGALPAPAALSPLFAGCKARSLASPFARHHVLQVKSL